MTETDLFNEIRPREHAAAISTKVTALIREELKQVPEKDRTAVVDLVLNGLCIDWSLKKERARK